MIFIFGSKGVTSTSGSGYFYCPQCGDQQPYEKKCVRRHATLFFVPTVAMGSGQEYVECQRCRGTFNPEVLDYDPEAEEREFRAEFHTAILNVMILMMMADKKIDDSEVTLIKEIFEKLTGVKLTFDIEGEISEVKVEGWSLKSRLRDLSGRLNDHGKEMVVKAAFLVATADGVFDKRERATLSDIAKSLEISSAHLNAIIQEMLEE